MSRPRKRRTADTAAVLAELRATAETLVTADDVAHFRGFGWGEAWARRQATDRQHRWLVREWEAHHRTSLTPPSKPAPVLVEGIDLAKTRAELEPHSG